MYVGRIKVNVGGNMVEDHRITITGDSDIVGQKLKTMRINKLFRVGVNIINKIVGS